MDQASFVLKQAQFPLWNQEEKQRTSPGDWTPSRLDCHPLHRGGSPVGPVRSRSPPGRYRDRRSVKLAGPRRTSTWDNARGHTQARVMV